MILFIAKAVHSIYFKNNPRKLRNIFLARIKARQLEALATGRICPLPILSIRMHLYHHPRVCIKTETRGVIRIRRGRRRNKRFLTRPWAREQALLLGRFTSCGSEKGRCWVRYRRLSDVFMNIGTLASEPAFRSGAHKGELQHKSSTSVSCSAELQIPSLSESAA